MRSVAYVVVRYGTGPGEADKICGVALSRSVAKQMANDACAADPASYGWGIEVWESDGPQRFTQRTGLLKRYRSHHTIWRAWK